MGKRRDVVCALCGCTIAYVAAIHSRATGKSYCGGAGCKKARRRKAATA